MKRITLICLVLITGCSENQELDKFESQWTMSWKVENEEMTGVLTLFNDHNATLLVHGETQSLLVKEPRKVNFRWRIGGDTLILKRLDNDIELAYEIIQESPNRMELAFAEDIAVTLYRH